MCLKIKRNYNIPLDDNQKEYREYFGIVDKYCIQMEKSNYNGRKSGFIVFIDTENDVDWIDFRGDDFWTKEELNQRDSIIARLNVIHCLPYKNISEQDVFDFKKMLASGYVLALQKQFNEVEFVIKSSQEFLKGRNREAARSMYLTISGFVAILVLAFWVFDSQVLFWNKEWIAGISMGILGAYVSVWTRYGKIDMTGLSSKWLHYLESLSRLFIGGIFAIVALHAIKCGIILSNLDESVIRFTFAITGFAAGFSERFVPSMIEQLTKSNTIHE